MRANRAHLRVRAAFAAVPARVNGSAPGCTPASRARELGRSLAGLAPDDALVGCTCVGSVAIRDGRGREPVGEEVFGD
jgi:hypothetical protein